MIDYVYTNQPIELAASAVAKIIKQHLNKGEHVLWLLSGGSGIPIAINASKKLINVNLANLAVSLTDERYGLVGHSDENWQQLIDGGFNLPGADCYRVLIGQNIEKTTMAFNSWLKTELQESNYKFGIFGFGVDGHTAGIKPHSKAISSPNFTASIAAKDFKRITMTFTAIKKLDEIIIQASGPDKQPILHNLLNHDISPEKQPVQILKTVPRATVYTNNKEDIK